MFLFAVAMTSSRNFHCDGEAPAVIAECLIDPGRLAIADGNEPDVHAAYPPFMPLPVFRGKASGRAERPEFLQIIELAHFG